MYTISFSLRAKHPVKIHVWAGISKPGRTRICIFEGILDTPLYIEVLNQTLLPFLERVYPHSHCFMADNDPKHTSREAIDWHAAHNVHWLWTVAESS